VRDHTGKTRRYWVVLKEIIRAAPCFFCVCWHSTRKQHFRSFFFRAAELVVLLSDCKRQSSNSRGNKVPPPPLTSFERFQISAGECLVVSTVALCGAKPNSLTSLGSVGLPLLEITM
jgi:hypothetical protein